MIRRDPQDRRRPRFGFTLIELLVVIVIIGILISLLLPVIIAAVRKAHEAQVSADIQTIATGLAKFKDTYGEFPPSRVILSENGVYSLQGTFPTPRRRPTTRRLLTAMPIMNGPGSTTNLTAAQIGNPDISFGTLAERSLRALRQFFTRASLVPTTQPGGAPYFPDFNGNGIQDAGYLYLEGDECLTFFLGGIPNPTTNANGKISYGMSGFGKEPLFPFKNAGRDLRRDVDHQPHSVVLRVQARPPHRRRRRRHPGLPGPERFERRRHVLRLLRRLRLGGLRPERRELRQRRRRSPCNGNTSPRPAPDVPAGGPARYVLPRAESLHLDRPVSTVARTSPNRFVHQRQQFSRSSRPGATACSAPAASGPATGTACPTPRVVALAAPEADNVSNFTSGRLN